MQLRHMKYIYLLKDISVSYWHLNNTNQLTLTNRIGFSIFSSTVKLLFWFSCWAAKHFHIKHHLIHETIMVGMKICISYSIYVWHWSIDRYQCSLSTTKKKKKKKRKIEGGVKVIVNTIFVCSMYLGVNE